jgi:type IV secretory pathway component VirB8
MGAAFVRLDIAMGQFIESNADQKEAFDWLHEQETIARKSRVRQFWAMIILTAIAAVAACIAAWPVLKG